MNTVGEWIVQNRDKIEKGVEIIGQAAEVLAATVGQLHPILEAVFQASSELCQNPDSQESQYIVQQLGQVNEKLEGIQNEIDQIALELQRTAMNKQNFDREAQMLSQYEKFQEFVTANPKFREKKKQKFLTHYDYTDGDVNLEALYNAVIGNSDFGDPILETVVATEQKSRRAVEEFCARLKKLFVVGIIAVMGHASLKNKDVGEEMVKKWQDRMEEVEKRMKAAVDDCIENFAVQAEQDMKLHLQEDPGKVDVEFTQTLLDKLVKKFDWVNWSIRAFLNSERNFFFNLMAGKKFHGIEGTNCFEILTKNNIKVVISYCVDPKPINRSQIEQLIETEKMKSDMKKVALNLHKGLPNLLIHAVNYYKEVVQTNNFHEDCYFFEKHKTAFLCIHPV